MSTHPSPSRELLRQPKGNHAYILALAASFPCLEHKVVGMTKFDADEWMKRSGPWSSGEKRCALFIVNVWNPGYAKSEGWHFDLFDFIGGVDTDNRKALLMWCIDPVWP